MYYKSLLTAVFACLIFIKGKSQQVENDFELLQILKIGEVYRNTPNLNYSMTYTYADSSLPGTILETMTGSCKLREGKFWRILDSVEFVQGQQFNVVIYHQDSTIVINDKK